MKNKLRISHTIYPDGVRLDHGNDDSFKKNHPILIIALLGIMLGYVLMTALLVLIYITNNL